MQVPAATANSELGEARQSLSYIVLLAAITAISRFLLGFDTALINGVLLLPSGSVGLNLRMFNRAAL